MRCVVVLWCLYGLGTFGTFRTHASYNTERLPALLVRSSAPYLKRREDMLLECVLRNESAGELEDFEWFRDGMNIDRQEGMQRDRHILRILGHRKISDQEGLYQCSATVTQPLTPALRLVSSHLVLKKAYIQKFPRAPSNQFGIPPNRKLPVVQGQVAYIPCVGLSESVPGPPRIWFERETEMIGGGRRIEEIRENPTSPRYLVTDTGVQIGVVQPSDQGRYRCLAQNTWTNQTRHNRWLELIVQPSAADTQITGPVTVTAGNLLYPRARETRVKLAQGQDAWLECISAGGRIVWSKINSTASFASGKRVKQVWGNLRIQKAKPSDSGSYICRVLPPVAKGDEIFATDPSILTDHRIPFAIFHVQVFAQAKPTLDVQTMDNGDLKISCSSDQYQKPHLFMRGSRFEDLSPQLNVKSSSASISSISVRLASSPEYSGTAQCLTLPLMHEEDLYGPGLLRGKMQSLNIKYEPPTTTVESVVPFMPSVRIDVAPENSTRLVNEEVTFMCMTDAHSVHWLKDGTRIEMGSRFNIIGSGTLNIDSIRRGDQGWYTCVAEGADGSKAIASAYLDVQDDMSLELDPDWQETALPPIETKPIGKIEAPQVFPSGTSVTVQWILPPTVSTDQVVHFKVQYKSQTSKERLWKTLDDDIPPEIRSKTVENLTPGENYKFRIGLVLSDKRVATSQATEYIQLEPILPKIVAPEFAPTILETKALSATAIEVKWSHPLEENQMIDGFTIQYRIARSSYAAGDMGMFYNTSVLGGQTREHVLDPLLPGTPYQVQMSALNSAGHGPLSLLVKTRTEKRGFDAAREQTTQSSTTQMPPKTEKPTALFNWSSQTLLIAMGSALAGLLLIIVVCMICCAMRQRKQNKMTTTARGKFFDASRRIFKEQRIEKGKMSLYHESLAATLADMDEGTVAADEQGIPMDASDRYHSTPQMSSFGPNNAPINLYTNPMEDEDLNVTHGIDGSPYFVEEDLEVLDIGDNQGSTPECDLPNGSPPFDLAPAASSSPTRGYLSPYHQALAAASLLPESDASGVNSSATTASVGSRRSPHDALQPPDYDSTAWSRSGQSSLSRNGEMGHPDQPRFYTFKPGSRQEGSVTPIGTLERIYSANHSGLNVSAES